MSKDEAVVISGIGVKQSQLMHLNGEYKVFRNQTAYSHQNTLSDKTYYIFKHFDPRKFGYAFAEGLARLFTGQSTDNLTPWTGWYLG